MSTYTIVLQGKAYAVGMNLLCDTVYAVDGSGQVDNIRTVADRNAAIMAVCQSFDSWRAAYNAARAAGNYIGMLFSYEQHAI